MRHTCPACRNVVAEQVGETVIFRGARGNGAVVERVRQFECGKCGRVWEPPQTIGTIFGVTVRTDPSLEPGACRIESEEKP